jgi:hypothetical protein
MARQNLFKIDDLLLRAGQSSGLFWLLGSAVALVVAADAGNGFAGAILLISVFASAPLGLLMAGYKLRRRENRAWALHRLVDDHVEVPVPELLRDSDFTMATLERAIRDLNSTGAAFLVWDREADVVQDGRLRRARIAVEDCGACGAKISLSLRIGEASRARCPYCHAPLGAERLMEEKARLIDELEGDPAAAPSPEQSDFSVGIFLALAFVFWPAAVVYALWHWRASRVAD